MVSHKISVESIEEVSSVLRRAPVLWDNIHANDYDPQRLFLGPYKVNPGARARARVCLKRSRPSVSGPSHRVDLQAERRPHQPQL